MRLRYIWQRRSVGLLACTALALAPGCNRGVGVAPNDATVDTDAGDADVPPSCGNGVLDTGEQCDGVNLGGQTCQGLGFGSGTLGCTASCTFDTTSCLGGCGNNLIEPGEICDGTDLGGASCTSAAGHSDGVLACAANCTLDTSDCHTCGDVVIQGPEECDASDLAGQTCTGLGYDEGTLACASDCSFDESGCASCGDNTASGSEQCDGADLAGASCNTLGWNQGTLACATDCTFDDSDCHTCGDDVIGGPEVCDGPDLGGQTCATQGFTHGDLACTANCLLDTSDCSTCGDALITGAEECDGANLGGQTCALLGYMPGGSLSCDSSCQFDRSQCTPQVCMPQSFSNPLGRGALDFYVQSTADVQLAAEAGTVFTDAGPSVGGVNDSALAFDLLAATSGTAGFLFTRTPAQTGLIAEVVDQLSRLSGVTGVSSTEVLSPGSPTVSHDGYDTVVSALVNLQTGANTNLSTLRGNVLAALYGLPVGSFTLPGPGGPSGTQFVVSFAVQWRSSSYVAVVGAVALQSEYNAGADTTFRVDDAGGGTGLAHAAATTSIVCFRYDQTSLPMADIIWVMDETGSMLTKLQEIAAESVSFFNTAGDYGLDFRMGVVNVEPSNNGEFCTAAGVSADHFLGPNDLADFQACVQQPSGGGTAATAFEYGITQGENAIANHLPRANQPDRIRPNATLAIIYVTDERAQELKDTCGANGVGMVPIDPVCLQGVIGPTVALLDPTHPTNPGKAYSLIQPPPIGCGSFSEVGQGYLDISIATGGQIHAICPTDLAPFMNAVLRDIIALAAPTKLNHRPISASLAVAKLDRSVTPAVSQPLARSRVDGFDYAPSSNGVVFINQDFSQLPYEMIIAYEHWQ